MNRDTLDTIRVARRMTCPVCGGRMWIDERMEDIVRRCPFCVETVPKEGLIERLFRIFCERIAK